MKGYDDLFLRVDFGSDGPDPIWRAGRRRCSPESSSVAALRRGWPISAFPGSKRATSGLGGDYATRVVLLGLLRGSGGGSRTTGAKAAAGLLGGARRRGEFQAVLVRNPGRKRLGERLRSEGKPVRALRGAAERCSESATANCGASGGGAVSFAVPASAVVY